MDRSILDKANIDVNSGVELLGDMEMYNETLQDFLDEIEDKMAKIEKYKNSNDMENYAIEVHSLKSDCKYIGFMHLADIAYDHELKSKEKNIEYVKAHFKELEEEYNRVIPIIKKYVENNPVEEEKEE